MLDLDDGLSGGWREKAAAWAGTKERIHELHLFGSRAKGDFSEGSDVDIGCILLGDDPDEVLAYSICECREWRNELQVVIGAPVQLDMANPLTDTVVWPAIREYGQLIYRRKGYPSIGGRV